MFVEKGVHTEDEVSKGGEVYKEYMDLEKSRDKTKRKGLEKVFTLSMLDLDDC